MKKGFTLIELLVVVLIIGILSSIALPQYTKAVEKSRASEAQAWLADFVTGESIYKMANGQYTATLTDLDVSLPASPLKNFTYSAPVLANSNKKVTATLTRTAGSSSMPYSLVVEMTHDSDTGLDSIVRYCTTNQKACRAINNGATDCAAPSTSTANWCYKG